MKRNVAVLLAALVAAGTLCAQEVTLSGELKTGFYMEQEKKGDNDPVAKGGMANNDGDSGRGEGRVRLNFSSTYGNMGLRVRFQIEPVGTGPFLPTWSFAYAYGNLFDDQLKISAGLLGESPWGSGGPKLWSEPETREYLSKTIISEEPYTTFEGLMGIRFEYKPFFAPGLNVGFVLNQADLVAVDINKQTFGDVLGESVVGVAYEHDYFAVRVGYRFDSKADNYDSVDDSGKKLNEGSRLNYRLEERILGNYIDGMQIWLNGYYYGIGCDQITERNRAPDGVTWLTKTRSAGEYLLNWLHWVWDADNFIAQLYAGYGMYKSYNNSNFNSIVTKRQEYQSLEFLPGFYYKFLGNRLQAGVGGGFGMEFGAGKTYKSSSYQYFRIEPQLKLVMSNNAYVSAVYDYTQKYVWSDEVEQRGEQSVKHSVNIRAVYTF
jgi:hypothetical protein